MTKIPLGFSKYIQLLCNSFFIISKLIALEIIAIGQVIKNFIFDLKAVRWTRVVSCDTSRVRRPGQLLPQTCNFPTLVLQVLVLAYYFQYSNIVVSIHAYEPHLQNHNI